MEAALAFEWFGVCCLGGNESNENVGGGERSVNVGTRFIFYYLWGHIRSSSLSFEFSFTILAP